MNQFKSLDTLFPCGKDRLCGEVVSVSVHISLSDIESFFVSWKRKAWYVNASVNAFHLHRGLCKELSNRLDGLDVPPSAQKKLKKLLAVAVDFAYRREAVGGEDGQQYYDFGLLQTVGNHYCLEFYDAVTSENSLQYAQVPEMWLPRWELIPFSFTH